MKDDKGNQSIAKGGQHSARGSQIGNRKSASGKRPVKFHSSFLKIMTGSDLSQRRIPYMRAEGHRKGPVVWLTACCHGDEVGGIVVVQEVFKRIRKIHLQRGTIHAFPLMNPLGFETGSRRILMSNEDLNRSFPGNPTGTLAERLADKIFQSILKTGPAVVIDLHNDWIRSIPYAVVDPLAEMTAGIADQVRTLAIASGLPVVLEQNALRHSLSHSLIQSGFPALTLELGESFVVNETNVDIGMKTIYRLLRVLDMIGGDDEDNFPVEISHAEGRSLNYSQLPNSSTSGIIRFLVQAGDTVEKDQPVAKIVNAFGKLRETIRAPGDGIVLGLSDSSVSFPGAPVLAFGLKK